MSIAALLRRDVYPRLDHRKVFGDLPGWVDESPRFAADCPLCGSPRGLVCDPNRAHGFCEARCGRISWWGSARRVRGLEPPQALAWLADRAGVDPGDSSEGRYDAIEEIDRRANMLELVYRLAAAQAAGNPELLEPLGLSEVLELGSYPGMKPVTAALRAAGFTKSEYAWLARERLAAGSIVTLHRGFEGEGLALWVFAHEGRRWTERLAWPAPSLSPPIPFRFDAVVGTRSLLVLEKAWDCLLAVKAGLHDTVALLPDVADAQLLASVLDWRVGTMYFEPGRRRLAERISQVKSAGGAVPFVLAIDPGADWAETLVARPGQRLFEGALHGVKWETLGRLAAFDLAAPRGREEATAEVYHAWTVCESPMERDQMAEALSEALNQPLRTLLDEFQVRQDRQTRTNLEARYRELFSAGEKLAAEGRFPELKDLLYRRNAEIAGRAFLERLEPFEPDRFFRSVRDLPEGIKTGYPDLDRYIRILPGELVVLAARPSHGKTTFGINLLYNLLNLNRVFRREDPFIFFSFELNEEFLTAKLLSRMTGRHSFYEVLEYLRSGLRTDTAIEEALARLKGFGPHLYLVSKPRFTGEDVLAFCQSVWYKHGRIGAVLVDYLQIVGTPGSMATREQEIAYVLKNMRIAGQEFRAPVITFAQAMRGGPDAAQERPGVHHLMDHRVIEQEANTILVLYNPEIQKAQTSRSDLLVEDDIVPFEVIVRKNKYGAINRIVQLEYKMRTNEIKNRGGFDLVYEI